MARYTVLKQVDAWVNYTAEVEADSSEQAVELAISGDIDARGIEWVEEGVSEFDHCEFYALDSEGKQIEETREERH